MPLFLFGAFILVKAANAVIPHTGYELWLRAFKLSLDGSRLFPTTVHSNNFFHFMGLERIQGSERTFLVSEIHGLGKNVGLGEPGLSVLEFERLEQSRDAALGIHIGCNLIIEAALELAALSGQFLRIEAQVLTAGGAGAYALEG